MVAGNQRWAVLLPYGAVLIGLYLAESAWVALFGYHIGILFALVWGADDGWRRLALRGWRAAHAPLWILPCLLTAPLLILMWPIVARNDVELAATLTGLGLGGSRWWIFMIYYATVHPILEELLWRGLIGPTPAARPAWTDAAFALYHLLVLVRFLAWPWLVPIALILTAAAWGWRTCRWRYDGLLVAIVLHGAADAAVVVATHWILSRAAT